MPEEVDRFLVTDPAGTYVDGTLGGGGHSAFLLERHPGLKIVGVDQDDAAIAAAREKLSPYGDRVTFARENFRSIETVLSGVGRSRVSGILLDLGVSSRQFDEAERGFSFRSGTLDMRMDRRLGRKAEDLVNTLPAEELADIFYLYGEEHRSRPIARLIVEERQRARITSGERLASIVERAVRQHGGRIHPATRVFQALRIAVNEEMESLKTFLEKAPSLVEAGGRVVIISYHSLEDRMVKQSFKTWAAGGGWSVLTKKIVEPSDDERGKNPRSRSAKLRAAERTPR